MTNIPIAFIPWAAWTKPRAWRKLAELHTDDSGETYVTIGHERDDGGYPFELLRLSRYSPKHDARTSAVLTPIRAFDESPVELSRRTRDQGVARFITNKNKPIFVLESGADVLEWVAMREGVSERELVEIMRLSEVGRVVRRKDRRALKASREEAKAKTIAYDELQHRAERDNAQIIVERDQAIEACARMADNLVSINERSGETPGSSGSMASPLGKPKASVFKAVTSKPLPGSYGG